MLTFYTFSLKYKYEVAFIALNVLFLVLNLNVLFFMYCARLCVFYVLCSPLCVLCIVLAFVCFMYCAHLCVFT
jgi:hypothetical protein